ncbi:hypothetical protein [Sphingomonas sp. ABOLF]|uniref:hypothetical protein n=1 Tax=Sphingomonas sp. ABOLF TaxID=1985879 RepID=UPI0019D1E49A|nr:hypothetical protein [Sphingomonas sp. ABOLF]
MIPDHRLEIGLLALMTVVVGVLAGWAIAKGSAGESAAWSAILMAIVNSIKERWQSRTIDRMGENLQRSAPTPQNVTETTVNGEQA